MLLLERLRFLWLVIAAIAGGLLCTFGLHRVPNFFVYPFYPGGGRVQQRKRGSCTRCHRGIEKVLSP